MPRTASIAQPLTRQLSTAPPVAAGADAPQRERVWLQQRQMASACRECPLGALATQTVWGEGPIGALLMLVGEHVALGATAARQLLKRPVPVMRERGQWATRADGHRVLITLHPSALLRVDPAERESAYRAWLHDLALASRYAHAHAHAHAHP